MDNLKIPINIHQQYHAHIYFDKDTLHFASELCATVGKKFGLHVGRVHQKPVGPHTKWSCQIQFRNEDFDTFMLWLDNHRVECSCPWFNR